MIKKLPESEGAVIGIEVSGKIDSMEENKWIEIFGKLIAEHGCINILILLDAKFSFGVDVTYDDLKWTLKNLKNMNKLAIVSESKVLAWPSVPGLLLQTAHLENWQVSVRSILKLGISRMHGTGLKSRCFINRSSHKSAAPLSLCFERN